MAGVQEFAGLLTYRAQAFWKEKNIESGDLMITFFRKKVTLTLEEMMNFQRLFNGLRLENEDLRLALNEAHALNEALKRELNSIKNLPLARRVSYGQQSTIYTLVHISTST